MQPKTLGANSKQNLVQSRETRVEGRRRRFRFENLEVWQEARALNRKVYGLTRKFPSEEQFGLTSQIRRASVSVSSNMAEGSGRNSDKDFAHFLEQAYGSLMEVASQFFLALDEHYLSENDAETLFEHIDKLAGKTVALNRALAVASSKVKLQSK